MPFIKEIINFLEEKFPPHLAYDWDNIGLQIGDINLEIRTMMIALEATTAVIDEAVRKGVDLIVTHHPFIFSPLKTVDFTTPQGKNIKKLVKSDIAVYAMHTNYDVAFGGMNDVLAEKIGLQDVKPFSMIDDVHGLGRIGVLAQPMNIESLSNMIRFEKLQVEVSAIKTVETVGARSIKKIAVMGGSGGKYIHEAKKAGADAFITGDITYHTAIDAKEIGLNILDIGHYAEVVMEEKVAALLNEQFDDLQVLRPASSINPIT